MFVVCLARNSRVLKSPQSERRETLNIFLQIFLLASRERKPEIAARTIQNMITEKVDRLSSKFLFRFSEVWWVLACGGG